MASRQARTRNGDFCPVRATLALVGQRWVPRILYELLDGKRRFNDLALIVGGCNSRTLRDRLKSLEEIGLVDPKAVMYLLGSEMDYQEGKMESGFSFKNPNEKGRCGCGESFHV